MQLQAALLTVFAVCAASVASQDVGVPTAGYVPPEAELVKDCIFAGARSSCGNSSARQLLDDCLASSSNDSKYKVHFLLGPMESTVPLLEAALPVLPGNPGVGWYPQNRSQWGESLMQLARGRQSFYDGLLLDPALVPELVASGALMDLEPYIATDAWMGRWPGILSNLRWHLSTMDQHSVYLLPLGAAAMVLHYRRDVLAAHGLGVPRTWEQLVQAVRQVHGRPAGPTAAAGAADKGFYGFCTLPFPGCHADAYELMSVWASFIQTSGVEQGAFFDPLTMDPLVENAAMAAALLIYRELSAHAPPHELNGTVTCSSMHGTAQHLYERGLCAFQIAPHPNHKRNLRLASSEAVRQSTHVAHLPGATLVLDRPTGRLVPCTVVNCPYGEAVPRWASDERVLAEVLWSKSRTIDYPAPVVGATEASDIHITSAMGTVNNSSSDASSSDVGGRMGTVLANVAPALALSPLTLGINEYTSPRQKAYSVHWLRQVTDPDVIWQLVVAPETPLAPFRYEHFSPSNMPVWLAAGYTTEQLSDYLELSYALLSHPNILSFPLRLQRFVNYRAALHATALNVSTNLQALSVDQIMSDLHNQLSIPYGPNALGFDTLRRQYLWSISRFDLLAAPSPPPPPRSPDERMYVGHSQRPSTVPKTDPGVAVGAAVGCLGLVGVASIVAFLYKRLMVERGWGRSKDPGVGRETTLVITDIEASTVLWEKLDARVMDVALSLHHDTIRRVILQWGGYESVTEGDSFTVAFHTAKAAVAFSLHVQSELMEQPWPAEVLEHEACRPVYVVSTKRLRHITAKAAARAAYTAFEALGDSETVPAAAGGTSSAVTSPGYKPSLLSLRTFSKVARRIEMLSGLSGHIRRSSSLISARPKSGSAVSGRSGGGMTGLLAFALAGGGSSAGGGGGGGNAAVTVSGAVVRQNDTGDSVLLEAAGAQYETFASSRNGFDHFLPYTSGAGGGSLTAAAAGTARPAVAATPPPALRMMLSPTVSVYAAPSPSSPSLSLGRLPGSWTFANGGAAATAASATATLVAVPPWPGSSASNVCERSPRQQLYHFDGIDPSDAPRGSSGAEQDTTAGLGSSSRTGGPTCSSPTSISMSLMLPPARAASGFRGLPYGTISSVPEDAPALQLVRRTQSTVVAAAGPAVMPGGVPAWNPGGGIRNAASGTGLVCGNRGLPWRASVDEGAMVARRPSRLAEAPPSALRVPDDGGDIQPYNAAGEYPDPRERLNPIMDADATVFHPTISAGPSVATVGGTGVTDEIVQMYGKNVLGKGMPEPAADTVAGAHELSFLRHAPVGPPGRSLQGWRSWTGLSLGIMRRVQQSFRVVARGASKVSFSSVRLAATIAAGSGGEGGGGDSDGITAAGAAGGTLNAPIMERLAEQEGGGDSDAGGEAGAAAGPVGGGGLAAAAGPGAIWETESRSSSQSNGTPSSTVSPGTSLHSALMHPGRRRRRDAEGGKAGRAKVLYSSPATYGSELKSIWSELPYNLGVDPATVGAVLVFRGFRVRCGMHSGVRTPSEINRNHPSGRTRYSGHALLSAKAISDAAHGGMVFASHSTVELCPPGFLAGRVVVWRLGDHVLGSPRLPASLYQLSNAALVLRAAMQRPLTRTFMPLGNGLLDAPLSVVACAAIKLSSASLLGEVHPAITLEAVTAFQALAYQYARLHGGYLAELGVGRALCVFSDAYRAALWAVTIQDRMFRHGWSDALLRTPQCEPRRLRTPQWETGGGLGCRTGDEVLVGRGPRIKAVVHFGPVSTMLHPLSGQLSYEGGAVDFALRLLGGLGPTGVVATLEAAASLRRYLPPEGNARPLLMPSNSANSRRVSQPQLPHSLPTPVRRAAAVAAAAAADDDAGVAAAAAAAESIGGVSGGGGADGGGGGGGGGSFQEGGEGSLSQRSSDAAWLGATATVVNQHPNHHLSHHYQHAMGTAPARARHVRSSVDASLAAARGGGANGRGTSSVGCGSPVMRIPSQPQLRLHRGSSASAAGMSSGSPRMLGTLAGASSLPLDGNADLTAAAASTAAAGAAGNTGVTWHQTELRAGSLSRDGGGGPSPCAAAPVIPMTDSAHTSGTEGTDGGGTVVGGSRQGSRMDSFISGSGGGGSARVGVGGGVGGTCTTAVPLSTALKHAMHSHRSDVPRLKGTTGSGGGDGSGNADSGRRENRAGGCGITYDAATVAAAAAIGSSTGGSGARGSPGQNDTSYLLLLTMSGDLPVAPSALQQANLSTTSLVTHALAGGNDATLPATTTTTATGSASERPHGHRTPEYAGVPPGHTASASALLGWGNGSNHPQRPPHRHKQQHPRPASPSLQQRPDAFMAALPEDPRDGSPDNGSSDGGSGSCQGGHLPPLAPGPPELGRAGKMGEKPPTHGSNGATVSGGEGDMAARNDTGTCERAVGDSTLKQLQQQRPPGSGAVVRQQHETRHPSHAQLISATVTAATAHLSGTAAVPPPLPPPQRQRRPPAWTPTSGSAEDSGQNALSPTHVSDSAEASSDPEALVLSGTGIRDVGGCGGAVPSSPLLQSPVTAAVAAAAAAAPGRGGGRAGQLARPLRPQHSARDSVAPNAAAAAAVAAISGGGPDGGLMGPQRANQSFTYGQRGAAMARPRLQDLLAVSPYLSPEPPASRLRGAGPRARTGAAGAGEDEPSVDSSGHQTLGEGRASRPGGGGADGSGMYSNGGQRGRGSGVGFRGGDGGGGGSGSGDREAAGMQNDPTGQSWTELPSPPSSRSGTGASMWGVPGGVAGSGSLESLIRGPHTRISRSFTFTTHRRSPLAISSYAGDPEVGTGATGAAAAAASGVTSTSRHMSGLSRVLYGAAAAVGVVPRDSSGGGGSAAATPTDASRDATHRSGGGAIVGGPSFTDAASLPHGSTAAVGTAAASGGGGSRGLRRNMSGGKCSTPPAAALTFIARARRGSPPSLQIMSSPFEGSLLARRPPGKAATSSSLTSGPVLSTTSLSPWPAARGSSSQPLPASAAVGEYPHSSNSNGTLRGSINSVQMRSSTGEIHVSGTDVRGSSASQVSGGAGDVSANGSTAVDAGHHFVSAAAPTSRQAGTSVASGVAGLFARVRSAANGSRSRLLSRTFLSGVAGGVPAGSQTLAAELQALPLRRITAAGVRTSLSGLTPPSPAGGPGALISNPDVATVPFEVPLARSGACTRAPTGTSAGPSCGSGGGTGSRTLRTALPGGEKLPTLPEAGLAPLLRELRHLRLRLVPIRLTARGGTVKGAAEEAAVRAALGALVGAEGETSAERAATTVLGRREGGGSGAAAGGERQPQQDESLPSGSKQGDVSAESRRQESPRGQPKAAVEKVLRNGRMSEYMQVYRVILMPLEPPTGTEVNGRSQRCHRSAQGHTSSSMLALANMSLGLNPAPPQGPVNLGSGPSGTATAGLDQKLLQAELQLAPAVMGAEPRVSGNTVSGNANSEMGPLSATRTNRALAGGVGSMTVSATLSGVYAGVLVSGLAGGGFNSSIGPFICPSTSPSVMVDVGGQSGRPSLEAAEEPQDQEDSEADLVHQFVSGFADLADPAFAEMWVSNPDLSLLKDRCITDVLQLRAKRAAEEAHLEMFERDGFLV